VAAKRYKEPVRLHWRDFYRLVAVDLTADGRYPPTVTLQLATMLDAESGLVSGPVSPAEGVEMESGWVFRLRPGCGCEPIYDAEEPPWETQMRAALGRGTSAPCSAG
jgi:hypothetical protein